MGVSSVAACWSWENVLQSDEDIRAGEQVFARNHLLRPQDIGYLAALGETELPVLLLCGELSLQGTTDRSTEKPEPGQVRDVNSYTSL